MVDIDLVDLLDLCNSGCPANRVLFDLLRELISFLGVKDFLRVVQTAQLVVLREDDSAGDDGSRERRQDGPSDRQDDDTS